MIEFGEHSIKPSNKRSVTNKTNKRIKYIHRIMNNNLIGASSNARDLLDYIQIVVSSSSYNESNRYFVYIDKGFRENYFAFLKAKNVDISIKTLERAIKELKERKALIPIQKGKYLYNFKDYGYVGNNEQYQQDIISYNIENLLNN